MHTGVRRSQPAELVEQLKRLRQVEARRLRSRSFHQNAHIVWLVTHRLAELPQRFPTTPLIPQRASYS